MDSGPSTARQVSSLLESVVTCGMQILRSVQLVNRRYHLPSQEEAKQSLRLIEQWKGEIGALKQEISSAEDALCTKRMELKSELEAKMTALRDKYQVAERELEEQTRLQNAGPRVQLEDLEKRLNLEQAFLAGIRKVPDEILVEILQQHLSGRLPSRQLASVCKGWKALIEGTPSFWRNIQASFVTAHNAEYEVAVLRRRIELSRSTLLDIKLILCNHVLEESQDDLFRLIAQTGIERWRSLKLWNVYPLQAQYFSLEGIFTGTFLALQSLDCDCSNFQEPLTDPCIPIYRLIVQSKPPIKRLMLNGRYPSIFQGTSIFRQIRELHIPVDVASQLFPLINLERLRVFGSGYRQDLSSWPPLPAYTCFMGSLNREQLANLQRQKVKDFAVASLDGDGFDIHIDFPELKSLSIAEGGLCSIERISAPKLTHLQMTTKWINPASRKKESSDTISLLRERPYNLTFRPISLTMDLALNTTAVLAVLQHWPQLQYLTITFGTEFSWRSAFPNAFTRKKNRVCPKLMSLRLILRLNILSTKLENWKNMLNSIYLARRNTPLQTIEWMFEHDWDQDGKWHSVTGA